MRLPTAFELLRGWEQGLDLAWHDRALLLLALAYPDADLEELARLAVGRRDTLLLRLREGMFGSALDSVTGCPLCGQRLELNFQVADIVCEETQQTSELELQVDNHQVGFRLPNTLDLAAAHKEKTPDLGRRTILERCVLSARHDRREVAVAELPETVAAAIETRMADADPQADIQLDVTCPACGRRWLAPFDIVPYLWAEIQAFVRRILHEVHVLASAYHWSEEQIVRMHPVKRQAYLKLVCP